MFVIPVYDQLILPEANIYLPTAQLNTGGMKLSVGEKVFFLIAKTSSPVYHEDSFYPIGVSGIVQEENNSGFLIIRTGQRINIESVAVHAEGIHVNAIRRNDIEDWDFAVEQEHLENLKRLIKSTMANFVWSRYIGALVDHWSSIGEMMTTLGMWLNMTPEEKYRLLEIDSRKERNEAYEHILYGYLEIARVNADAQNAQTQEYEQAYKEQAIRKQMEYLQNELNKMHPENVSDIDRLEKKIHESGMNEEALKEAEKMIGRMKQEGKQSPEYGSLYDYLDFLTSLKWTKEEPREIDLKEAEKILDEDHFGLKKVKNRVLQQLAIMNLKHTQSGSILLFVGAPGTGKTSIASSIAKAMKRSYIRISLGGVRDEADIRGHRRTYIGAMPGRIINGISKSGSSNPLIVLDEVDKLGQSYNGDPASALLEVLDPEQNHTFTDHYLNVPYDLSQVLFICTANTVDTIPEPLLNRMEVIFFNGYTASDKFQIARRHLLPKAMENAGIEPGRLKVSDGALRKMIDSYTMEGGVRGLKKVLDSLCRGCAIALASGKSEVISVTKQNVASYLDEKEIRHTHISRRKQPGIVTGLAWTPAGGEILFVETLKMKGNGKVTVTGRLGEVMKESVSIALSLVKAQYPQFEEELKQSDLHIHVPEGAVKKDGPSAGITLTTALASLLTGHPVDPSIGMTGEVSLKGNVMPIGGLPEKLMAAVRSGVKTVLIPDDNTEDLKDVPKEALDALKIIPVKTVKEVFAYTGIPHQGK